MDKYQRVSLTKHGYFIYFIITFHGVLFWLPFDPEVGPGGVNRFHGASTEEFGGSGDSDFIVAVFKSFLLLLCVLLLLFRFVL